MRAGSLATEAVKFLTPYPLLRDDWKECFPSVSPEKQKAQHISAKPSLLLAIPEGLEPSTY